MYYIPENEFLGAAFWAIYDEDDPPSVEEFPRLISEGIRVATILEEVAMNVGYVDATREAPGQPAPAQATIPESPELG